MGLVEQDDNGTHPDREYQIDEILELVSQLYSVYYRRDSDVARHRLEIEVALNRLMIAWNGYLG